ncbi:Hydrophobic surface binding protein [Mycena venus]|uniref:Hydrophobic surface binding protein n=1 Tax=Mycena venus TaxID=2733690 RepID=A0A8H7CW98_9AGAR|nr:Hydrophobic surface binding protein [Mycena venus]
MYSHSGRLIKPFSVSSRRSNRYKRRRVVRGHNPSVETWFSSLAYYSRSLWLRLALLPPFKRTVAQVESDIASISSQVTTLDNDIKGFPASGLVGALVLAAAFPSACFHVLLSINGQKATGSVSEADANTILKSVMAFEPTILDALTQIATKKAAFDALPVGGLSALVLQDLQNLKTFTDGFSSALITSAPVRLCCRLERTTNIDNGFTTAIAAYE